MRFFSIGNIEELDFNALVRQLGGGGWNPFTTRGQYVRAILESYDLLQQFEINTPARLAHFIGQGLVETGGLAHRVENLNYSAERLRRIFPRYFPTDEIAREYERKPERIANRVYANRLGNGPPESGDGWRYRGRGFFQLTGKANYLKYGEIAGFDLVNDPELIERDLKKSLHVAAAYFKSAGLGPFADRDDSAAVSRGVNRGDPLDTAPAHGEADRILWTNRALDLVKDPQKLLVRASNDEVLRNGASGERVRELQRALAELGYPVGAADGIFGPATRRAVVNFQNEHGLETTGAVDQATQAAITAALGGPVEAAPPPVSPPVAPPPVAPPPVAQPEAPVAESPPPAVAQEPAAPVAETPAPAPVEPPPPEPSAPEPAPEPPPSAPEQPAPEAPVAAPEAPAAEGSPSEAPPPEAPTTTEPPQPEAPAASSDTPPTEGRT
ncbi:MAG: hypothetical protein A4S17_06165 [Proteobacteria bacterium HN_bin10]|nr:MAG: hypothetical protein A4S17_06165 [Proteobacteria bacterium HN_bin10]